MFNITGHLTEALRTMNLDVQQRIEEAHAAASAPPELQRARTIRRVGSVGCLGFCGKIF